MIARGVLISLILFSSPSASAQDSPKERIIDVLNAQARAWNEGDVARFMQGYQESDSTRFVSAKGVVKGYRNVLARYLAAYPTKEKMGELSFGELDVRMLSEDFAIVIGKWTLKRRESEGGNAGGYFTLIFQRTTSGWKIIHDHTS
ncbi:MAG: nuclear transport factor 2 family protein [Chloroherpetonaceae bacterium]|nr:nuclear transport factor 2 family protein [Chloroherpetonaceae bacterium]MDW8437203.1 nuclear transport factor 2 family protein [Chloroherpetonaceae bacterium]